MPLRMPSAWLRAPPWRRPTIFWIRWKALWIATSAGVRLSDVLAAPCCFDHPHRRGSALSAALRQNARGARLWKFPFRARLNFEIDPALVKYSLHRGFRALRSLRLALYEWDPAPHCRLYKAFHVASTGQPRRQVRPQPVTRLRDRLSGIDSRLPHAEGA